MLYKRDKLKLRDPGTMILITVLSVVIGTGVSCAFIFGGGLVGDPQFDDDPLDPIVDPLLILGII